MSNQKCSTKGCRNRAKTTYCSTCRSRKSRQNNPARYCYLNLKNNAKRRGVVFNLSFDEFLQFCYVTNYLKGKGKTSDSFSIDRQNNKKGYTADNIRLMTLGENSRKGTKVLLYDWQTKNATVINNQPACYDVDSDFF